MGVAVPATIKRSRRDYRLLHYPQVRSITPLPSVFRRYIGLEFRHQHPEAMQRLNFISGFHRFGERP